MLESNCSIICFSWTKWKGRSIARFDWKIQRKRWRTAEKKPTKKKLKAENDIAKAQKKREKVLEAFVDSKKREDLNKKKRKDLDNCGKKRVVTIEYEEVLQI